MILASTLHLRRETEREKIKTKDNAHEEKRTDKRKTTNKDHVGWNKIHTNKTLYKIIQTTPNTQIPKRNLSVLSKPLVLFQTIFRE
jgi:hypothetical protein